MPPYALMMFDLDGTLTDSAPGITHSVRYALDRLGISVDDPGVFRRFIGPPLMDSFQRYCGLDGEGARLAVARYREYYARDGIFECALYPGIAELLARLHDRGRTVALATSKPAVYAGRVLGNLGIARFFSAISGESLDGPPLGKDGLIRRVLADFPEISPSRAVMIGDREYDILGARANHVPSIAVTYGYGSPEELAAAGPDYTADSAEAVAAIAGLAGNEG